MEEDIKILENLSKNNYYGDVTFTREAEAIENLLKAYKQDEEVIDLMAEFIDSHTYREKEYGCDMEFEKGVHCGEYSECKDCIKEYFRKKVGSNERN